MISESNQWIFAVGGSDEPLEAHSEVLWLSLHRNQIFWLTITWYFSNHSYWVLYKTASNSRLSWMLTFWPVVTLTGILFFCLLQAYSRSLLLKTCNRGCLKFLSLWGFVHKPIFECFIRLWASLWSLVWKSLSDMLQCWIIKIMRAECLQSHNQPGDRCLLHFSHFAASFTKGLCDSMTTSPLQMSQYDIV